MEMKSIGLIDRSSNTVQDRVAPRTGERADRKGLTFWMVEHLKRRRWPLVVMLTFVIVSMAYSLWWNQVVHHVQVWVIPGDIWSTFRAAHWVGWGDIGGIYGSDTQLLTFPGIAVLLAPVAMVSGALALGESHAPIFNSQPSSWLLLGPVILLLGSTCLIAFDAMAEELGVSGPRRIVLSFMEAVVIFQVVTLWGHPEDLLALTFASVCTLGHVPLSMVPVRLVVGSGHRFPTAGYPDVSSGFRPNTQAPTHSPVSLRSPPHSCASERSARDAMAPDFSGLLPSGQCQVARSCDSLDCTVAYLLADDGRRRTWANDRGVGGHHDRLPGLSTATHRPLASSGCAPWP